MKAQSHGKRKAALDDALKMMLEYREALESSLSRYTATPLGIYEENGRVYSSQLSFFTACSPASGKGGGNALTVL
jgi:type IV secretion system protein VirB4